MLDDEVGPAGSSGDTVTPEGPAVGVPDAASEPEASRPGRVRRARLAFRRWRRSRPFWGGLLILLGGGEILLTVKAPLPVIIHIGLQGTASYVVPLVLFVCGLLVWFNPAQRLFYGILALILALVSWLTSNLGGFFIGMLQGIIGACLVLAWSPKRRPPKKPKRSAPPADEQAGAVAVSEQHPYG